MNFYPAYICKNGHAISTSALSCDVEYCTECSAPVISACPNCQNMIRGHVYGVSGYYKVPSYCHKCGHAFPWTEKAIQSAIALLAEDENLTADECNRLIEVLPDTIAETPGTQLAAARFKKALRFLGDIAADGIRQFIIDFGCELMKKHLGL